MIGNSFNHQHGWGEIHNGELCGSQLGFFSKHTKIIFQLKKNHKKRRTSLFSQTHSRRKVLSTCRNLLSKNPSTTNEITMSTNSNKIEIQTFFFAALPHSFTLLEDLHWVTIYSLNREREREDERPRWCKERWIIRQNFSKERERERSAQILSTSRERGHLFSGGRNWEGDCDAALRERCFDESRAVDVI